ncbi:putative membrane protein [Glycine max]|nr:putative membrane protein [Glycine max]
MTSGVIFCPLVCLVMAIGNSAIIHGLWPIHCIWTYYRVVRSKKLGPALKFVRCTCVLPSVLILWPMAGIVRSVIGGAAYGFFAPIFATFEAVEGGKENKLFHCFIDVKNECYDSYFSFMNDLLQPNRKYYEIRLRYLLGAIVVVILGIIIGMPVISVVAIFKGPYMLFKGWKRLFHDLIGCEGPFLETICVPFAALAIVLWPLAVVGRVLASALASFVCGGYGGFITYQVNPFTSFKSIDTIVTNLL